MSKVKLGVIGIGGMGSGHVNNILQGKCPEMEVVAVADRRASRREWAEKTIPGVQIFSEGRI